MGGKTWLSGACVPTGCKRDPDATRNISTSRHPRAQPQPSLQAGAAEAIRLMAMQRLRALSGYAPGHGGVRPQGSLG